jgi:hypothetical protein
MSAELLSMLFARRWSTNKQGALDKMKHWQRLWGVDQHYVDRTTGKTVPVMNYFCATPAELVEVLRDEVPEKHWNCYEMLLGEHPCVLFFDLENHEIVLADLMERVKAFIWTVPGLEDVDIDYGVKDACDGPKISRHVLVWMYRRSTGNEVRLKNIAHVGALARRIVASFVSLEAAERNERDALPADVLTFDLGVYTNDRQFRLVGNDKWGKGRPMCYVLDGVKLSPRESLKFLEKLLVQDPYRFFPVADIISVTEADGSEPGSSSIGVLPYRRDRYEDTQSFRELIERRGRRTGLPAPRRESSATRRPLSERPVLLPHETVFGVTPAWSSVEMPLFFFNSFPALMEAHPEPAALRVPHFLPSASKLLALHLTAYNRAVMPDAQLDMLALIRRPRGQATAEQEAALNFIGFSTATRLNLAEMCALWVADLTGDSRVTLGLFDGNDNSSFMLNCNKTKLCGIKGSEHKSNHIYFIVDVEKKTVQQKCRDQLDCGGDREGILVELPPCLKAALSLAWEWRQLYTDSFGQILEEQMIKD